MGVRRWPASMVGLWLVAQIAAGGATVDAQDPLGDLLRARFAARLEAIAEAADGVVGYVVVDVEGGDRFARLESTQFPAASTIKLAILYELMRRADEGRVALDRVEPLDRSRAVPGGLLHELTQPSLSPRDLAVAMILQSDNTATNVLIDRLGMAAVNRRMAELGLKATWLRRHMLDTDAARRGDENVSTPADLARLIVAFHHGEGLSAEAKATALDILRKPKRTPITSGVPPSVHVASKSGELDGVRADAGIVYVPGRPYVLAAMGTYFGAAPRPADSLEALARTSYEYFARRATATAYGRQLP